MPHKPVFSFTRWMFLQCADWTSHVWSLLPAGFRWILCGGNAPHIACSLTPEKEGFIEISAHMSGVFAPQSNMVFRPFTKYKNIVLLLNSDSVLQNITFEHVCLNISSFCCHDYLGRQSLHRSPSSVNEIYVLGLNWKHELQTDSSVKLQKLRER